MRQEIPMLGLKFGRLIVIYRASNGPAGRRWMCHCSCGGTTIAYGADLRSGHTKSCGCWSRETTARIMTTHGCTKGGKSTPELICWNLIRRRCENPNEPGFKWYGGKGIKLCERWQDFSLFLADMGRRPSPGHSIDRIDGNKDYEPGNCRWATEKEQQNNRSDNRIVSWHGRSNTLSGWSEELGISPHTLGKRLDRWSVDDAMTRPLRADSRRKNAIRV